MFGLLILVAILAVFGFILSWIAGVIAGAEISVPRSMAILFTNGIANYFVAIGVADMGLGGTFIQLGISLLVLAMLLWILADIAINKAIMIASIFATLTFLAKLAIAAIVS